MLRMSIDKTVRDILDLVCEISSLPAMQHASLFRMILYADVLATLSAITYPQDKDRERFVRLIKDFGRWDDAERVSLPHLRNSLQQGSRTPACECLLTWVEQQLAAWLDWGRLTLDIDPTEAELRKQAKTSGLSDTECNDLVKDSQHAQLLYLLRCNMMHEFQAGPHGIGLAEDEVPLYTAPVVGKLDDGIAGLAPHLSDSKSRVGYHWQLVHPETFMRELCQNVLVSIGNYWEANGIDSSEALKNPGYLVRRARTP